VKHLDPIRWEVWNVAPEQSPDAPVGIQVSDHDPNPGPVKPE